MKRIVDCNKCLALGINYSTTKEENLLFAYQYKPEIVKVLWIVESPPYSNPPRYFYRPELTKHDSLYKEVMKSLDIIPSSPKADSLNKFKQLGYFLIDAAKCPIDKKNSRLKTQIIKNCSSILQQEVISLEPEKIIIIKATLYNDVYKCLCEIGFDKNIINSKPIPFPGSGQQRRFRNAIEELNLRLKNRVNPANPKNSSCKKTSPR
jgi:hypothetical protein